MLAFGLHTYAHTHKYIHTQHIHTHCNRKGTAEVTEERTNKGYRAQITD